MRRALVVGDAASWFVHAHHADMRRMPRPAPGRVVSDRTCAALVWNTFRTLALIDPSFWLRQVHARLFEFDQWAAGLASEGRVVDVGMVMVIEERSGCGLAGWTQRDIWRAPHHSAGRCAGS
jgi:hypothetical protein